MVDELNVRLGEVLVVVGHRDNSAVEDSLIQQHYHLGPTEFASAGGPAFDLPAFVLPAIVVDMAYLIAVVVGCNQEGSDLVVVAAVEVDILFAALDMSL